MKNERLTIGELSRRTGLPVKTLRFWSDEGLLPASRSSSGYRLYGEEELGRLDLVRTLRDAGLGLDAIRKVLSHDTSLADALRLQLAAVEAHVASLQGVAAALRAALQRGEPNASDVRRLCAVTRLTNEERLAVIEQFHERVAEGMPVDEAWRKKMFATTTPKLPSDPTAAQLDAWIELADLVADPSFIENLRASAILTQEKNIDVNKLRLANEGVAAAAGALRAQNLGPASEESGKMVRDYVEAVARACGQERRRRVRPHVSRALPSPRSPHGAVSRVACDPERSAFVHGNGG